MDRFAAFAIACACLLPAACGGTAKQSAISPPVAAQLAAEADAVAATLRTGNGCAAAAQARTLRSHIASAIAAGGIPASLAADARVSAARVVSEISCIQPAPQPEPAPAPHAKPKHDKPPKKDKKH